MRPVYLMALWVCACGARSEIAGSDLFDASIATSDGSATTDAGMSGDATGTVDGGVDAIACTAAVVQIACANNCANCKFDVEWTCGDVKYRIGGGCDPASLFPDAAFIEGVCDENGKQTSTFKDPATTCDCTDASALLTVVQEKCTHQ